MNQDCHPCTSVPCFRGESGPRWDKSLVNFSVLVKCGHEVTSYFEILQQVGAPRAGSSGSGNPTLRRTTHSPLNRQTSLSHACDALQPAGFHDSLSIRKMNSEPFICRFPHCRASYRRKEHRRRHEAQHSQNQVFKCTTCGQAFGRRYA